MVDINLGSIQVQMDVNGNVVNRSLTRYKTVEPGYSFKIVDLEKLKQKSRRFSLLDYSLDIFGEKVTEGSMMYMGCIKEDLEENTLEVSFKFEIVPIVIPKVEPKPEKDKDLPW